MKEEYFSLYNNTSCAGKHLIIDIWGASRLSDANYIEKAMVNMANAAGANILKIFLHRFEPNNGVTGVLVLAESHITVHTWPEKQFVAFDIFMCGNARTDMAIDVLKSNFPSATFKVSEYLRGEKMDNKA